LCPRPTNAAFGSTEGAIFMSRSPVLPAADLTDPWLARVWRAFHAKRLPLSHLRILVLLHKAAAGGGMTARQLADRTGSSLTTVSVALSRARALGLVYREKSPGPGRQSDRFLPMLPR
jgi:DNA-binding transcriptional ArsR family regulator